MDKDKHKSIISAKSIERHSTAPWTNFEKTQPISNVFVPNEIEVSNAKDWVDSNQK